jgi:hypothetical protein
VLGSSTVTGAGYDAASRVLRVVFAGSTYDYADVEPEVFEGLANAPSPGRYVRHAIAEGRVSKRVSEPVEWTDEPW